MLLSNLELVPGRRVVKHLGLVQGSTVRAKHVGKDLFAGLKNIIGGELKAYTELLKESREEAVERMVKQAESAGANAVLNIRVPGPTLDALWQAADSTKNTITVTVKEGGKLVDKTFPLGKHSKIDPAVAPGGRVLLQFSAVDKSKVVLVQAVSDDDL